MSIEIKNEAASGNVDAKVQLVAGSIDSLANPAELKARGFEGKAGQSALSTADGETVLYIGTGTDSLDTDGARKLGAALTRGAWKLSNISAELSELSDADLSRAFVEGVLLAEYQFNNYKNESKPCQISAVCSSTLDSEGAKVGQVMAEATMLARDLINTPPSDMTPSEIVDRTTTAVEGLGIELTVWDEKDAKRERLGGLLGVAAGSHQPPRLIQLKYKPAGASKSIAFVGKGITFDSGGLSIKPASGMETMKTDMSGAASVMAATIALAKLGAKVNVHTVMCCTENMPGGGATKPGDVLTFRNGKTAEVLNTDAEGRLVLADGLSLAVEESPDAVVDVATLTGACVVALGKEIGGLMGNNDDLIAAAKSAGKREGEQLWELPLPDSYKKHIESEIADIKNIGKGGEAGTISAALFLKEFVGDTPWIHLDIAGPARSDADDGIFAKGASGFSVRTLVELARSYS